MDCWLVLQVISLAFDCIVCTRFQTNLRELCRTCLTTKSPSTLQNHPRLFTFYLSKFQVYSLSFLLGVLKQSRMCCIGEEKLISSRQLFFLHSNLRAKYKKSLWTERRVKLPRHSQNKLKQWSGLISQSCMWMTSEMRHSGSCFLQGNTEMRPLLHPVWWPSAQQDGWKDFNGAVSVPRWFYVHPSSFVSLLTMPVPEAVNVGLNCSFRSMFFALIVCY